MNNQRGFVTLEIILAMAIMVTVLSAVVLMLFGGQSLAGDLQNNAQALALAQTLLEKQVILAKKDFRLINPVIFEKGIFNCEMDVIGKPFFKKIIFARISWISGGRRQEVRLPSLVTDYDDTVGSDTCDSNLTGDWTMPQIRKVIGLADFAESATSSFAISDVDAYKNKLYLAIGKTTDKTDPTFYIFDISDPFAPLMLNRIDNASSTIYGINKIVAAGWHVYAAGSGFKQLQVIDVASSTSKIVADYKITGGGDGSSVFYENGYLYLGLRKSGSIPEFYIFDVKDPTNIILKSNFLVGAGINDIYVKNGYAFLAHPANLAESQESAREQLTVLDVSDSTHPRRVSGFYNNGNLGGNGKSLYLVGDYLYLGRTTSHISGLADAIPEFYVIDHSNPEAVFSIASSSIALPQVDSVNGVLIRDYLAFLLGKNSLRAIKIKDNGETSDWGSINFESQAGAEFEPSFDCEGNNFFVGYNNGGKGYLSVITGR